MKKTKKNYKGALLRRVIVRNAKNILGKKKRGQERGGQGN